MHALSEQIMHVVGNCGSRICLYSKVRSYHCYKHTRDLQSPIICGYSSVIVEQDIQTGHGGLFDRLYRLIVKQYVVPFDSKFNGTFEPNKLHRVLLI